MKYKEILVSILLAVPVIAQSATPIICKSDSANKEASSLWPGIYLSKPGTLCFDVKSWPEYSGSNCVTNGKSISWTGLVIVTEDGESQGRDSTKFRVRIPTIDDERIEYTIEWTRGSQWRPMQHVYINRLTGGAVDYFIHEQGGESLQCHLGRKAI